MKKVLIVFLIVFGFLGFAFSSNAEELPETETTETILEDEDKDALRESAEYYIKQVITFVTSLGGASMGLLLVLKKILKALSEVKSGTKSMDDLRLELETQKKALLEQKDNFVEASKVLMESLKNQEELEKLDANTKKIIEALKLMITNDSKLVANGVAKKISEALEEE